MYLTIDETLMNVCFWKYKPYWDKDTGDWKHKNSRSYLGCISSVDHLSTAHFVTARKLIEKLLKRKLKRRKIYKY